MLVFTDNIRWLVIWSIIDGGFLCLLYDVIRVMRNIFSVSTDVSRMKKGKFFPFKMFFLVASDFLFCLVTAISFLVLSYYTNGGVFRGLVVICAIIGFIAVRLTLSKVFVYLLYKVALVIKKLLRLLCIVAVKIVKPIFWLYHLTLGRIICIIKDRIKKKRERREEEKMRIAGKEENVTVEENQAENKRKERIVIGRRTENS